MRGWLIFLGVLGISSSTQAQASNIYVRHFLPEGKRITLLDEELHAFTFDEYIELLKIDSTLHQCLLTKDNLFSFQSTSKQIIREQENILSALEEQERVLSLDNDRLNTLVRDTVVVYEETVHKAKKRAKIGWAIAGGLGMILGGVILGVVQ